MPIIVSSNPNYEKRLAGIRRLVAIGFGKNDLSDEDISDDVFLGDANRYITGEVENYEDLLNTRIIELDGNYTHDDSGGLILDGTFRASNTRLTISDTSMAGDDNSDKLDIPTPQDDDVILIKNFSDPTHILNSFFVTRSHSIPGLTVGLFDGTWDMPHDRTLYSGSNNIVFEIFAQDKKHNDLEVAVQKRCAAELLKSTARPIDLDSLSIGDRQLYLDIPETIKRYESDVIRIVGKLNSDENSVPCPIFEIIEL